jgi:hypothetical protein
MVKVGHAGIANSIGLRRDWRHRVLQHLPYRISRKPKLPGYRPLTLAFDSNCTPNTPVYLHLEHPSGVP